MPLIEMRAQIQTVQCFGAVWLFHSKMYNFHGKYKDVIRSMLVSLPDTMEVGQNFNFGVATCVHQRAELAPETSKVG